MENQLKTVCTVPGQPVFCFHGTPSKNIPASYPVKARKEWIPRGWLISFTLGTFSKNHKRKDSIPMTKNTKKTTARHLKELADQYRLNVPHNLKNGVVVIYKNKVVGWMNKIKDPQVWKPGCFAVNEDGRIWLSVGGSQDEGAESWQPQDERV